MIREIGISLLAVAGFGLALWRCRIVAATEDAVKFSMAGLMSMLDSELDDAAKETAVRRAGIDLIVASFRILWRFSLALVAAAAPIVLADVLDLVSRGSVLELMLRLDYIFAVSVVAIVFAGMYRRWGPAAESVPTNRYSMADRLFHAVAFARPGVLKAASRIEDRLVSKSAQEPSGPPIFITSLARGGTTALLNALHDIPGIATHTYRDMPFLTAPTLWNRLAGGKMRRVDRHERAHGDGLEIDLDSPEAFEEVIWKMFWPEKFRGSSIALWRAEDRKEDAEQFLRRHMAKVVGTRLAAGRDRDANAGPARYCSKDNTNIGRIPYLVEAFPGCRIVVPIRRPESHAASLLNQHKNFLALQAEDDFVRRYMRDIGHFEFGLIHKPIGFPGFDAESYDPETGDYWLHYWIQAFQEVLEHSGNCILVSQDDLRSSPQATMTRLCSTLGLPHPPVPFAAYFRSGPDESRTDVYDQRLYAKAASLYRELAAAGL